MRISDWSSDVCSSDLHEKGRPLSLEALTEWLAGHAGLPYLKIDPMKINVASVTQVVSQAYAKRHRILPIAAATGEVTFATCEPFERSEERRVGKEWVSTFRPGGSP